MRKKIHIVADKCERKFRRQKLEKKRTHLREFASAKEARTA
jgi:hypothetical protein